MKFRVIALVVGLTLLSTPLMAQSTQEMQKRFDQEPDPIRRARMMMDLGRADFREVRTLMAAGNDQEALKILAQLRDDARKCMEDLDKRESNPEKHSSGFKQLEIAMRESIGRMDDLMVGLMSDEQDPFAAIRKDLEAINTHLVHELFPHQPPAPEPEGKR